MAWPRAPIVERIDFWEDGAHARRWRAPTSPETRPDRDSQTGGSQFARRGPISCSSVRSETSSSVRARASWSIAAIR